MFFVKRKPKGLSVLRRIRHPTGSHILSTSTSRQNMVRKSVWPHRVLIDHVHGIRSLGLNRAFGIRKKMPTNRNMPRAPLGALSLFQLGIANEKNMAGEGRPGQNDRLGSCFPFPTNLPSSACEREHPCRTSFFRCTQVPVRGKLLGALRARQGRWKPPCESYLSPSKGTTFVCMFLMVVYPFHLGLKGNWRKPKGNEGKPKGRDPI